MASAISIPAPILSLFQKFPLHTYPPILTDSARKSNSASSSSLATLWIHPPKPDIVVPSTNLLSQDVDSLKWQAYIALRLGHRRATAETSVPADSIVAVRWDVAEEGGVDGRLPSLQTKDRKLLGARSIPGWVDETLGEDAADPLEGYADENARDESRAWVSLLEGDVQAALALSKPRSSTFKSLLFHGPAALSPPSLATTLTPPPAPLSGLTSLIHSLTGERISITSVQSQYREAIASLSNRLGSDGWFLGSSGPTSLDALAFAYLHCLLNGPDTVRVDVARRENLVAWERKVRVIVQSTFVPYERLR